MEVVAGWTHRLIPIDDPSRVGEARRFAAQLAAEAGMDEVQAGRLALCVTELGTNLVRHAKGGRLLLAFRPHAQDVELVAIDDGPGIADLALALQDGQSSGSTPGTGLGAIRRLASEFDIHSSQLGGTVCVARVAGKPADRVPGSDPAQAPAFEFGAIAITAPGEQVSGDGWMLVRHDAQWRLLVADGLGHGPEAAKAAQAATEAFSRLAPAAGPAPVGDWVQRVHAALQGTRGAAVCIAALDAGAAGLAYAGAGNVVGRVVSGVYDRSIATQHGTAGLQIRRPEVTQLALPEHALLVLHSDGIDTRWNADRIRGALRLDPVLVAALLLRDHSRQRDDATIVVLRRKD